jgi:hypothetical protein
MISLSRWSRQRERECVCVCDTVCVFFLFFLCLFFVCTSAPLRFRVSESLLQVLIHQYPSSLIVQ